MSRQEKLAALASTGVTKTELDNIDGGTARGTTAIADGDGVLINDAGTMRMTSVETMATYMGTKITGGSMVYIASSGAISNAADVEFRAQDGHFNSSKYDHYQFWFQYVTPATDGANMFAYASTDDGSNYDTTSGNYRVNGSTEVAGFILGGPIGSDSNENGISGNFQLFAPHNTSTYTYCLPSVVYTHNGATQLIIHYAGYGSYGGASIHRVAADVDAIKFQFDSGNIESGEIVMYGIANGT